MVWLYFVPQRFKNSPVKGELMRLLQAHNSIIAKTVGSYFLIVP